MQLSTSFTIDPHAPWVIEHNREVREVMDAYEHDRPIRVPLIPGEWYGQHGWFADEIELDFRDYYTNPDEMVRVQLEAARRRRELPIYDMVLGELPESWSVSVDQWPAVAPGWFGCPLQYRKDAVIAHSGLELSKEACAALTMPDPLQGGILATIMRFWNYLQEKYLGSFRFLGVPIGTINPGVGTAGPFSLALDIRGAEIMADMYDDPAFAHAFLEKMAICCETLERTWLELCDIPVGPFTISDHGIDMLSCAMYEEYIVPLVLEMNRRRGTTPVADLHHCGRGSHLFPVMQRAYGKLNSINALTYPLVDVAKVRYDLGEDVWITSIIDDAIIQSGPADRIYEVVKEYLTAVKGKARFALMVGDMLKGTPMDHRLAYYQAVREYGRY